MIKLSIHSERCKACGLCVAHCPRELLQAGSAMNEAGHHPVVQNDPEECTGCAICAMMCPDICFTIHKTNEQGQTNEEEVAE